MSRCPCTFSEIEPCQDNCTCMNPYSSRGCIRCATYGSYEQRVKKAKWLANIIDQYVEKHYGNEEEDRSSVDRK